MTLPIICGMSLSLLKKELTLEYRHSWVSGACFAKQLVRLTRKVYLKRYRSEAFLEDRFEGVRKYNKEIITILKHGCVVDSHSLLEQFGIDPKSLLAKTGIRRRELMTFGCGQQRLGRTK